MKTTTTPIRRRRTRSRAVTLGIVVILLAMGVLVAEAFSQPQGFAYNLSTRCVKSVNPSGANYYSDVSECRSYTLGVQSETLSRVSCPGPENQSLPVNKSNSPVEVRWLDHFGDWSVNIKLNFQSKKPHPCGPGYWTWLAFMDHANHGGGPLPHPSQAWSRVTLWYDDWVTNGEARLAAGYQGWWNNQSFLIELDLASTNWPDAHSSPAVKFIREDSPQFLFILADGAYWGLSATRQQAQTLEIDWAQIVADLAQLGILPAPPQQSATQAIFFAVEVRGNNPNGTGANADLWFSEWRIEAR